MSKLQKGFTMIELVMVIVILGILAAVALPRFYDLQTDARKAKADGIFGTVRSAAAIAHSAFLVGGNSAATSVTLEGLAIPLVNAYPTANAVGRHERDARPLLVMRGVHAESRPAANLNASNDNVTISAGGGNANSNITIRINGAPTPANCQISYTAAAANAAPTIAITKTGC